MSGDTIRIALAQLNPTVGDVAGNLRLARTAIAQARGEGADIIVFSELFACGYPPEDLALNPGFQRAVMEGVRALAGELTPDDPAVVMGTLWVEDTAPDHASPSAPPQSGTLHNAAAVLDAGAITAVSFKAQLPNYGVFDEKRVFTPGPMPGPVTVRGLRVGLPICEDMWFDEVCECLAETGAELLIVPNGSPFTVKKWALREQMAVARVTENELPLIYVNQVGGQDELVFDGASFALNADRSLAAQVPAFAEGVYVTTWARAPEGWRCTEAPRAELHLDDACIYTACVVGLRDYVRKNGFSSVVIGLSGGIDSAIVAAMATDALGPDAVHCIMMPYAYTASDSLEDAAACARALGVRYDVVEIHAAVEGFTATLADLFAGRPSDVTEENLQSRVRGTTLMAISNKFGGLVLTTGNKSEVAVGYATLYGDMNGAYNPIKDLYKTTVYRLAAMRNQTHVEGWLGPRVGAGERAQSPGEVIPQRILTKAPSAELRPDQTDQDSLPDYDTLDAILAGLIEEDLSVDDVAARGHGREMVAKVARLVQIAEYKRRQAAPGPKISTRAFLRERRYPITNGYR